MFASPIVQSAASLQLPDPPKTTYTIVLDGGTTTDCSFEDLVQVGSPDAAPTTDSNIDLFSSLPHFLQRNSKLTMDHEGDFHKGYVY